MLQRTTQFGIGTRVKSVAVGRRKAFVGTIRAAMNDAWHVRADDDGRLWHRANSELSLHTDESHT
jgi:hypothetical protein